MRLLSPLLALAFLAAPVQAQLAVGGQIGDPTGLSIKAGAGPGALLLAVGWDLGDSVSAEGHYVLSQRRVQGADANLGLFYGPGLFLKARDEGPGDEIAFGISLGIGLEASLTRDIEAYGLISPRIRLIESTDFDLGGGIGLRLRL